MYNLHKYLLVLIMICLLAIPLQNREFIKPEQHSLYKDSASEIEELINYADNIINKQSEQEQRIYCNDSILEENIQWKFKKHLILGN